MAATGVWMWPQSILARGAEKTADDCVRARITDIFFLVKGLRGTTAYPGSFAPSLCERDLLRELICAAHTRGIRVHAWFTSACDEHYKSLHPESGRCHYTRGKDRELIALTDEGYLAYMGQIVREVCRNYDIDGLHLDYIRYNHALYGWSEEDMKRYEAEGASIPHLRSLIESTFFLEPMQLGLLFDAWRSGDESALAFSRVRRTDVCRFARLLIDAARCEKSSLTVSAALMPEGAYEDTAFADVHYGQNYSDAAELYDFVLPMAYSRAYDQDAAWVRTVAEGSVSKGLKTVMGLHAYEGGTGPSLQADLLALRGAPVDGVCYFRESAFAMAFQDNRKLRIFNPFEESISSVSAFSGSEWHELRADIPSGEEALLTLPFEPHSLRIHTGDKERCVLLVPDK